MLKILSDDDDDSVAPDEEREISITVSATVSTGSQRGDSLSLGSAPMVVADCSMRGIASVAFQIPCWRSPMT